MADRRLLAGSITESGQVASLVKRCGAYAGLFFTWCIPFVDDDARLVGDPDALRYKIMGRFLEEVSTEDIERFITVMDELRLIVWYEVLNSPAERFIYVPKFSLHQTLRADRYGPSRFPPPPSWVPEEGHPYAKTPALKTQKPQRDTRRTVRVRRDGATLAPGSQPPRDRLVPLAQPSGDHSATAPRTSGRKPAAEDSAPLASSRLLSESDRILSLSDTAQPDAAAIAARDAEDACVSRIYHELVDTARQASDGRVIAGDGSTHESQNALVIWANQEARTRARAAMSESAVAAS